MMKQILEKFPEAGTLQATLDLLRYENAAQKTRILTLEASLEELAAAGKEKDVTIAAQQEVIDLLNAELYAARDTQ